MGMNEMQRFESAFNAELEANPDKAPGPTAIRQRMGLPANGATISGRLSARRIQMLTEAGFVKNDRGRWEKK